MAIELIADKATWDRFIDESPNSLLFHKWDFLQIVEKHTRYKLFPYGIYLGGELVSVIPLFYQKRKGLKFVYSPPQMTLSYLPYLGFAYSRAYGEMRQREKENYLLYITNELEKVLRRLSPNYISLCLEPGDVDTRPYRWNGYEPLLQYTYKISLNQPLETIWKSLDNTCRKTITDASKSNLSIERAYDARALFDMMRERLSHYGKTFYHKQSPDYLKDMMSAFPDNIRMYFVYHGDELAGASVNYGYRKCYMGWMGAGAVKKNMDVNEFMIWSMIKKAKEDGYEEFENAGADERRLNPFKVKFNPSLMPYYFIIKKDALYRTASNASEMLERIIER
jgi:hypothetical protein